MRCILKLLQGAFQQGKGIGDKGFSVFELVDVQSG